MPITRWWDSLAHCSLLTAHLLAAHWAQPLSLLSSQRSLKLMPGVSLRSPDSPTTVSPSAAPPPPLPSHISSSKRTNMRHVRADSLS
jgi:hypothetical protein